MRLSSLAILLSFCGLDSQIRAADNEAELFFTPPGFDRAGQPVHARGENVAGVAIRPESRN